MNLNKTDALGKEAIGRLLLKLALPAIVAQIINLLYNLVDRMYIGRIPGVGRLAFTGVGVCMSVIMLLSAFAALVSMGGAPRAAIFLGRGDRETAEKILGNSAALLIVVSVVLTVAVSVFAGRLLMLFGASSNTIGYALEYMKVYGLGTVFVMVTLGLNAYISAQGFSTVSMLAVIIGAALNIALDPVLIFTFNMGVAGAAVATVISQMASAIFVVAFLMSKRSVVRLKLKNLRLNAKIVLPCIALGLSPFIMQATESAIAICFNTSLLAYGSDLAVGAMTVLMSVMQITMLPLQGLTQGAQPIISYNFGARNAARCKKAFKLLLICCLAFTTAMWLSAMLAPGFFVRLFNDDAEFVSFTSRALRIYLMTSCIFGAQVACQQTFIAIGNAKTSVFLAVLRKIVLLIPLIFILPLILPDKTTAVFLAEPVADTISVITTVSLFSVSFKKAMRSIESKEITE